MEETTPAKAMMEKIEGPKRKSKKARKRVELSEERPEISSEIFGTQPVAHCENIGEAWEEIEHQRRKKKREPSIGMEM